MTTRHSHFAPSPTRRRFIAGAGAMAAFALTPAPGTAAPSRRDYRLIPAAATLPLVGAGQPPTALWCFNGSVPGPEIRVRLGERLRVAVDNRLGRDTTVHWHGLRFANAMDGVPGLTQKPIAAGAGFVYEFTPPDAGTFWYHPHVATSEQLGRGLYGVVIVDEPSPIAVDRDVVWVLDDWRLTREAAVHESFGNLRDASHAGRIGNTVTINGRVPDTFAVRAGEHVRLRLVNTANARIFTLTFEGHAPQIIALDGQPVAPHAPEGGRVVVAPAQRVDLVVDMAGDPDSRHRVIDSRDPRRPFRLVDLVYDRAPPLHASPLDAPVRLAANRLPEPDLATARRHDIVLAGGAMGRMRSAILDGARTDIREMVARGKAWSINDVAAHAMAMTPLATMQRGRTQLLRIRNDTVWPHPMHLHGFHFRLLSRNGAPVAQRPWLDTVLMERGETVEVAFVADNPGDWLFHCHVLEHVEAGMLAVFRVT